MITREPMPRSLPAAFELPAGMLISIVCVVLCLWLLANSGLREVRDVAIAVAIGLAFYGATRVAHSCFNQQLK
jgi:hypothetical protein